MCFQLHQVKCGGLLCLLHIHIHSQASHALCILWGENHDFSLMMYAVVYITSPIILVGLQLRFSVWINMMLWGKLVPVLQVIITLKVQNQYLTFNITIARYLAWRARKRPFMFLNPLSPSSESSPLYWDKLYYGLCDFLFLLLTLLWMRFLCFNNGRVLRWLPFWKVHCLNNVAH